MSSNHGGDGTHDGAGDGISVGIIGCGALGSIHARNFCRIPGVSVTALSDPSEEAARRASVGLPSAPAIFSDYQRLLESPLDAVCIASPDGFHVRQLLDAFNAGLDVLCEKPLTPRPDELIRVIAERDRSGRVLSMTYPRHYDPGIRKMRREIRSGEWGPVRAITAYNAEDWVTPNLGQWRHDPEICPGGFFYDASGHQLDTIFWVTGLHAESVRGFSDNRGLAVPIVVWGTATLNQAVPMTFAFIGDAHRWREQVNFHCEKRDFVMDTGRTFWTIDGELQPIAPGEPREGCEEAFVRLLRGEGPNWSPPEELWPLLLFTQGTLSSAEVGRELEIDAPPQK